MKKTLAIVLIIPILLFAAAFGLDELAQKNAQKAHVELMQTLLPGGKDFVRVPYDGEDETIRSVHQCQAGFVIETVAQGYADEITMYIGVDNEGKVMGLVAYEAHETPGLGNQILTNDAFLSQFLNRDGTFTIGEPTADTIGVDGISGATVTSRAVVKCVDSAVRYVTGEDLPEADAGSSATP